MTHAPDCDLGADCTCGQGTDAEFAAETGGVDNAVALGHTRVMKHDVTRNRRTGRYTDTKFDKPCTCGHPLGEHTAERAGTEQPCLHDGCTCDSFKKATKR